MTTIVHVGDVIKFVEKVSSTSNKGKYR